MGIMYIKTDTYNKITTLGKNKFYYYLTVSSYNTQEDMDDFENAISEANFTYTLDKIDPDKDVTTQIYELLLTEPQFQGGSLISS